MEEEDKRFHLDKKWGTVMFIIAAAVITNILAVIYIKAGKNIYFWDDATYWDISRRIASGAISGGGFWRNVYASVAAEDYNYIAALPSALLARIFGESRLVYVLGLVNMYLVPSYIVIYLIARKIGKAPKITFAVIFLLYPVMMFLAFNGFVDIGALLMCLAAYNLYYVKKDGEERLWHYIVIGLLLTAAVLWRRYFAFFTVSFMTAMFADCALFRRKWRYIAATALTVGAVLLIFFSDFVFYKLMADYGNLYAGYKFSVATDLKLITRYFGLALIITLAVSSVFIGIKRKDTRPVFMWLQILVCAIMFLSTQTHGQQHLLLYVPSLIVLTVIAVRHITKEWMLIGICALAAAHTMLVYIPREQPRNIQEIKHMAVIPTFSMLPVSRSDTEEILALKEKLDATVVEGDTLGVLASSFRLNEDVLKNVQPSLGKKSPRKDYIVSLPQVDSRDTDLTALYTVNYILAAFPAETHLAEGSQTVVTEAVRSFESYWDIATAYLEIPDCETTIDGMTIKLFQRQRDERRADIAAFESRLYKEAS